MTATKEDVTATWNNITPVSNDGTALVAYAEWPNPVTSDWLIVTFAAGGFAYRVTNDSSDAFDLATRGAGLTSSTGAASTKDLSADIGGLLDDSGVNNPDLNDAARYYIKYTSSDLWIGNGFGTWALNNTQTTWQFRGMANLRGSINQVLADANTANYSKILVYGRSAGAYGVFYNWGWIYDTVTAAGYECYGVSDGATPFGYTGFNNIGAFYNSETRKMVKFWDAPLQGSSSPSNDTIPFPATMSAVVTSWTDEQRNRFLIFLGQTDTAALEWHGITLTTLTTAEKLWGAEYADYVHTQLSLLPQGVNVWSPFYASLSGGDFDSGHIMCGSTFYNSTLLVADQTPQQALSEFIAGTPVRVIEARGAAIT